jgi:hypothetical protein
MNHADDKVERSLLLVSYGTLEIARDSLIPVSVFENGASSRVSNRCLAVFSINILRRSVPVSRSICEYEIVSNLNTC